MISWRELEGGGLGFWEKRRERKSKKRKDDKLAGKQRRARGKWQDGY